MKLEVRNVSYSYARRTKGPSLEKPDALVLDDVSFTMDTGEMIAFLGKNGAGKTTLLRIIPSFLRPLAGEVLVDGSRISDMPLEERAKAIAYIPQFSQSAFAYTVQESVLMGRSPYISVFGKPSKGDEDKALDVLDELGIAELAQRPTTEVSGGERQLVLIARALMQDARILILDEPTSFLDYSNQMLVLEKALELSKKGYSCLYSTHNPDLALAYSTKVLAMDKGRIAFMKKPAELEGSDMLSRIYGRPLSVERTANGRLICVPQ